MLQDLCGWIMRRMGVRPRPFRSRLLVYVPLLLALYMFAWPPFYRLAVAPWTRPDLQWPGFSVHLTTTEFWKTFPGVLVAVPFLLVCGFACVYFLGSKGFCTYGCPYGGFFAPLDRLAPGRIRVTDACEGCGHCTAVCTSNVRVHEEVREYGMVVDPGCMKCLDCVSVCPKEALYFGFGRPEVLKRPPRREAPLRRWDLTWPQEFALAAVFLLAFLSLRGAYGLVPMLMAGGAAAVVTFLCWTLWRMRREPNVSLHRLQLRRGGKIGRAGAAFAVLAAAALALTAQGGAVNALEAAARIAERAQRTDGARALYTRAGAIGEGGIGLLGNPGIDLALARLHHARGDDAAAETMLRRALGRSPDNLAVLRGLALLLHERGSLAEAVEHTRRAAELDAANPHAHAALAFLLAETGDAEGAAVAASRALELAPRDDVLRGQMNRILTSRPASQRP
jgi:Flp pilus assembly protein TadD/ferredoxin